MRRQTSFSNLPQDRKVDLAVGALQVIAQAIGLVAAVITVAG
jgi:hypothetical protein